ncbi:hypothetical protein [Roseomonas populi]|uniref:Calcium-binding protein n=1 Tax=Roseomonas populi TaxID=3121582 RepID=A0ABT1X0Y3_9PROT|nr:hypothetical protein [Roseomonas pecuniae]MCR0980837.1 hypothetical protein [Roseomonas pecuniae]
MAPVELVEGRSDPEPVALPGGQDSADDAPSTAAAFAERSGAQDVTICSCTQIYVPPPVVLPVAREIGPVDANGVLRPSGGGTIADPNFRGITGAAVLSLATGAWTVDLGTEATQASARPGDGFFRIQAEGTRTTSLSVVSDPDLMTTRTWVLGSTGNDRIESGSTADRLEGGAGSDTLRGGAGDDSFVFRPGQLGGDAEVDGGIGWDTLRLLGGEGIASGDFARIRDIEAISVARTDGNAVYDLTGAGAAFTGGRVWMVLNAEDTGTHVVRGPDDAEAFTFKGGAGVDHVMLGPGRNVVTGGGGADIYNFDHVVARPLGDAVVITDFADGEDRIEITAGARGWNATVGTLLAYVQESPDGLQLNAKGYSQQILLKGITASQLWIDDFVTPWAAPAGTAPSQDWHVDSGTAPSMHGGSGTDRLVVTMQPGDVLTDSFFESLDGFDALVLAGTGGAGGQQSVVMGPNASHAFGTSRPISVTADPDTALSLDYRDLPNGGTIDLHGSNLDDVIVAGWGPDIIDGGLGNDTIDGGGGFDLMRGGDGDDTFIINAGHVGSGISSNSSIGYLLLDGGAGWDTLQFNTSVMDPIFGMRGIRNIEEIRIAPTPSRSTYHFPAFDLFGAPTFTDNKVFINAHDAGSSGVDISSSALNENTSATVIGSAGDDVLDLFYSNATMTGGAGADSFRLSSHRGLLTITDFENGVDHLMRPAGAYGWTSSTFQSIVDGARDTPDGLLIGLAGEANTLLVGMNRAQFDFSDFVLYL